MQIHDHPALKAEARNLNFYYGGFHALKHINLDLPKNKVTAFIGPSGCGKSTIMKLVTGLLPASEGRASLFGRAVDPHDIDTRRRVGYMSQAFSLYGELTVRQNLVLHAQLFHLPADTLDARVQEMVDRFGLGEYLDMNLFYDPARIVELALGRAPGLDPRLRVILLEDRSLRRLGRTPHLAEWLDVAALLGRASTVDRLVAASKLAAS